jgi:hypothetical protein
LMFCATLYAWPARFCFGSVTVRFDDELETALLGLPVPIVVVAANTAESGRHREIAKALVLCCFEYSFTENKLIVALR